MSLGKAFMSDMIKAYLKLRIKCNGLNSKFLVDMKAPSICTCSSFKVNISFHNVTLILAE
jgi:hypothetical protein